MKILIIILITILSFGCQNKNLNEEEDNPSLPIVEEDKEEVNLYVDDNPITVGIYMVQDRIRLLSDDHGTFKPSVDIGSYKCVFTNKDVLEEGKFKVVFQNYYKMYNNIDNYKIGYHIHFALTTGEVIDKTILKPSDVRSYYAYVMSYLYDSIHQTGFYTHLSDDDIKDNTIIPSIKLTGGSGIDLVIEPILLTTFTYDSMDDFDDNGHYRGISSYTIPIYRK